MKSQLFTKVDLVKAIGKITVDFVIPFARGKGQKGRELTAQAALKLVRDRGTGKP